MLAAGTAARFAPIVGSRNRVVHLHDRVDEKRVYEILTLYRQELSQLADLLLDALEDRED